MLRKTSALKVDAKGLAWTPENRLVYTSSAGGNTDIWIMDADGLNRSQLTTAPGADA